MKRALVAVLLLLPIGGCAWHARRNAPGRIDPRKPPVDIASPEVETPADPGEHIVVVSAGGFGGIGGGFAGDGYDGLDFVGDVGAEISVHYGSSDESHAKPDLLPLPHVFPRRTTGVNVGFSLLSSVTRGEEDGAESLGSLYVEVERRELFFTGAVGYGWDPDDESHGPQATLAVSALYLRAQYHWDRGAQVTIGAILKLPVSITWSR